MSIAGGIYKSLERGRSIGCDAIQIFTKSASQWRAKPLTEEDCLRFKQARKEQNIEQVVAHDSYLINLASPDDQLWQKSIDAFCDEMERCRQLGVDKLVTHPGSHIDSGLETGIARIAEALNRVVEKLPSGNKVTILLETTAGMGSSVGHGFEQLAAIRRAVKKKSRIAYCLDTAHILAAGYRLDTPTEYQELLAKWDRLLGLDKLLAVHLNGSKKELGSKVDRHERIGEGYISQTALARFAADHRLAHAPVLLETPGGMEAFAEDLALLRKLVKRVRY